MNECETVLSEIVLDYSHGSAIDLDVAIVRYAHSRGYGGFDEHLIEHDTDKEDYAEALQWESDSAIMWLNDNVADHGSYFVIEDNSLFIEKGDRTW